MLTTATILPTMVTTYADPKKGSLQNKSECIGEHFKNNLKTDAVILTTAGAGAGLTYAAVKNEKFATVIEKPFVKIAEMLKNNKTLSQIPKLLKKVPTLAKVGVAVTAGFAILSNVFKSGQIDQKYTDKAKLENYDEKHKIEDKI